MFDTVTENYKCPAGETFTQDSMCDKLALEPLSIRITRMLEAGQRASDLRHGLYDFDGEVADFDSVNPIRVFEGDLVEMTEEYNTALANLSKPKDETKVDNE